MSSAQRRWLIDGMNVIGARADRWWNDPDRAVRDLIAELASFASQTGREVTVVFDRRPPGEEPGSHRDVEVRFATRRGRNAADHDIVEIVASDEDPGSLTVVTSDRRLGERVRELGAAVMGAGSFRRRLER